MASKWRDREGGGWERDVYEGVAVLEPCSEGEYQGYVIESDDIPSEKKIYPFYAYYGEDEMSETSMKRELMRMCNEYSTEFDYVCRNKDDVWFPIVKRPMKKSKDISAIWKPASDGQRKFMKAEQYAEAVFGGGRAVGKSTTLLMSFLAHCDVGHINMWAGYAFFPDSSKMDKFNQVCHKWIPQLFPNVRYDATHHTWRFPKGETLSLVVLRSNFLLTRHTGKDYSWVGFDNMQDWQDDSYYVESFNLLQHNKNKNIPLMLRGTVSFEVDENDMNKPADTWINRRFRIPHNLDTPLIGLLPDTSLGKSMSLFTHNTGIDASQVLCKGEEQNEAA